MLSLLTVDQGMSCTLEERVDDLRIAQSGSKYLLTNHGMYRCRISSRVVVGSPQYA